MTAVERLDEIGAHLNAAYKELGDVCAVGPSKRFRMSIPANPERDTDLLIDQALTDATQLGAALRAVLAVHAPDQEGDPDAECAGCLLVDPGAFVPYPCPTVCAIAAALDVSR